ncbi:DUF1684 domain-containing protein [Cellulomonas sp. Leaf395]|uniref:DUF1684 domain-containing protein n=1 Tax=Cellulomonas sp. Leaf395 TaxID=1736362 RepID=UPI0006F5E608|nr:DUF1684 domain-containing protein [Cellulomonas sp. Leaf395]KQS97508.1 hypothetical protein ASG23_18475 [Cellulomonas sp. Leaf395]
MTTLATDPTIDLQDWRADREAALRQPHGWLSLTGLYALTSEPRTIPGVPGRWWTDGNDALVQTDAADGVTEPQTRDALVGTWQRTVCEGLSTLVAAFVPAGRDDVDRVVVELVRRTGRLYLRVRDPRAAARTDFAGVPAYGYDPSWVLDVPVRWYDEPVQVTVGAAQHGLVHHVRLVGEIDIERDGAVHILRLTAGHAAGSASVLFSDEAADLAPWRILSLEADAEADPTADTLRIDLNRTINLPYAFSDFGTCPAPVEGNHLPFAVPVGELDPRGANPPGLPSAD